MYMNCEHICILALSRCSASQHRAYWKCLTSSAGVVIWTLVRHKLSFIQVFSLSSVLYGLHEGLKFKCCEFKVQVCRSRWAWVDFKTGLLCGVTGCVLGQTFPGENGEGAEPDRDQRPSGAAVRDARWARLSKEVCCSWWRKRRHYGSKWRKP